MAEKIKQAALYIRVSTEAQSEEGYSIDAQLEKLENYCKAMGIESYQPYIDGGWSGSNLNRPKMEELIQDIESKIIDAVIVYKLDRLSRSQADTLHLIDKVFIPNDCAFISLNEKFDTATPYGKAMIGILSAFAQLERENIRERTRMGMMERIKEGYWPGGGIPPFGYNYDSKSGILVPNDNADDVRNIFRLYLDGYSTTQLAEMYAVANDTQITAILKRRTYLGIIPYNNKEYKGKHQPVIDEETWYRAQAELERRSTRKAATTSHLLTGLLVCGKCGAKMRYQKWGKNAVKVYCYSQDGSKKHLVKDPDCDNLRYDSCDIEDVVLKDLFEKTKTIKGKLADSTEKVFATALNELKKKESELTAKIKNLYTLYAKDTNPLLLETITDLQAELEKTRKSIENEEKMNQTVADIKTRNEVIYNLEGMWDSMTIRERQQALRICIDKIEICDTRVDITYAF